MRKTYKKNWNKLENQTKANKRATLEINKYIYYLAVLIRFSPHKVKVLSDTQMVVSHVGGLIVRV